ncbi:MAG: hypothetical protein K0V04_25390 [Deltaproteobacteria bacterium]|nr:hypothetical protein [Deltaproteobacteria bacterium]
MRRTSTLRAFALALPWTLALASACRPEPSGNNEPPTGATQSEPSVAAASATKPDVETTHADTVAAKPDVEPPPVEPPPEVAADPLAPLPKEVFERFANLPRDPKPDSLIRNSHYWISNELNQQLWHPHIADLGGAYLGVGTDQNYMLAGWAKSDLIVVVDFDIAIVDLHRVYTLFFEHAETFEDFMARWSPEREEEGLTLIDDNYAERDDYKRIRKAYKIARKLVWARLRTVRKAYTALGIPTFITDQAQYDHIRTLSRNGRIFAVRGDFTANETMMAVADAMTESGFAFNVIYLSNVEQYIDYTPEFRRNLSRQPVGDKGMVVRTLGWSAFGFAPEEEYHYNVQPAPKFTEWLKVSRVTNLPRMLHYRTRTDIEGLSLLDGEVRVAKRPPKIAE